MVFVITEIWVGLQININSITDVRLLICSGAGTRDP